MKGQPLRETNFMIQLIVNHMTTDELEHRKLSYWQLTILALQFTKAVSRLFVVSLQSIKLIRQQDVYIGYQQFHAFSEKWYDSRLLTVGT